MAKRRQRRTLAQELLLFFGLYMLCAVTFQMNKQVGLWLIYASLGFTCLRILSFILFRVVIPAVEITGEIVQDFTDILRILYHVTIGPIVRLCAPLLELVLQARTSEAHTRQRNDQQQERPTEEEPHTHHRRSHSERSREAPPREQTETPEERQRRRQEQRQRMAEEEAQNQQASCFEVLGIPPDADYEAGRRAYLELSKKYHPDKVQHLGEELQTLAEERFKAIQKAWEEFKLR